jgi:hypothetical protein
MLLKAKGAKGAKRVDGKNPRRRLVGEKGDRDGDQPSHQMRVAVAAIMEDHFARGAFSRLALQPNLADAAPHLVHAVMRRLAERLERVAQFDDVAVAILPIVEGGKIFADCFNRRQGNLATFLCPGALYGESTVAGQRYRSDLSGSIHAVIPPGRPARTDPQRHARNHS